MSTPVFNIGPPGWWLYRASNSQWQGNNAISGAESYGAGPYQHYVDFDLLGDNFRVSFGGGLGSSGVSAPGFTWNIRIGGSIALESDSLQPITGDQVVIGTTGAVPAFGQWSVLTAAPVENIWSGTQIVKLTASLPGGGGFALRPTLFFLPGAL